MSQPDDPSTPPPPKRPARGGAGTMDGFQRFALLAGSSFLLFLAGSAWLSLYPGVPQDLGGAPDLDREARALRIPVGSDSLSLWTLPGTKPAVIVILHGYARDHSRAWRYASFLERAGYAIVAVDFRSSQPTHRKPTTLGHYEAEDAEAVLSWVERAPAFRGRRIGMLGESLGGSVALGLAAAHSAVAAVVADCPFSSGRAALEDSFEHWVGLPRWPFALLARGFGWMVTGYDPWALDLIPAARALVDRPVFFIASERDDRFSAEQTLQLWRAAGARKPLWVVPGVGHNEAWLKRRDDYERRVLAFFDHELLGKGPGLPGGAMP